MSNVNTKLKEGCEHSNKNCTCGGHNNKNHKKHKSHNSTKKKLTIKNIRRFKDFIFGKESNDTIDTN